MPEFSVSVDALPAATEAGLNDAVAPVGKPVADKVTVPLPVSAAVEITLVPDAPARTPTADGVAVRLKSTGVIVNDKTAVWLSVPSRPLTVTV